MKLEQLIVQHLYGNKSVTLQGIGTIRLNPDIAIPTDADKEISIPENAFTFEYDLKATEDDALINHIVQQTRKIRPLASADLDSYVVLAKQFLNIGKPLVIEGIGTIQKNQEGFYVFTPGHFITPRIDEYPRQLKEKHEDNISFESESRNKGGQRNLLIGVIALIVVLAGLGIYYLFFNQKQPATVTPDIPQTDTVKKDTIVPQKPDTIVQVQPALPVKDSNSFAVVIREYTNSEQAHKAFDKFTGYGHKLEFVTVDSEHFRLVMPFKRPIGDSSKTRDSIRQLFGGNPIITR